MSPNLRRTSHSTTTIAHLARPGNRYGIGGRGGTQPLPLLERGVVDIEELQEEARRLGLTMSSEDAKVAEYFTDALDKLWKVVKMGVFRVGAALAPVLQKLTKSEKELSGIIFDRLRENESIGRIRSKGDRSLFGGRTTQDMKDKLGVPKGHPLVDFLPTVTIKAKDFADEITNFNIKQNDLRTGPRISNEHVKNSEEVRKLLVDRGIVPGALPPAEDGKADCIVVYKVDRLSRSLIDFARIMDVLERHAVSSVSVTRRFNTSTSMGRLMLNVLLSFARFEREVISERTRDKIAAARREGKWVGGRPILGYDIVSNVNGGRVVVNEDEAAQVRQIFALYLRNRSLFATLREVDRQGWRTRQWTTKKGQARGGRRFTKEPPHRLPANLGYTGNPFFQAWGTAGSQAATYVSWYQRT